MKICFVAPNLSLASGWGRYTNDLVTCAKKSGHDVGVVELDDAKFSIRNAVGAWRGCRGADIIYAVDGWPFGVIAWIVSRFRRALLIVGAVGTYAVAPLDERRKSWLVRRAYASADAIIAISLYTRDRLIAKVPQLRVSVITPGVLPGFWKTERSRTGTACMISVGALKARKGYLTALEAFALAKRQIPNLRWVIVGDKGHTSYVSRLRERAVELGVIGDIEFTGNIEDSELRERYADADLFVLLSENQGLRFEGFGIVFLEAAAAGLPVLGTTENGIADAVGPENGVLVAQGDYKAAADAIVAILGDRDRWERMSTASRLWAEMNNLDSMCRAHEEIYKGIIRKSNKTV